MHATRESVETSVGRAGDAGEVVDPERALLRRLAGSSTAMLRARARVAGLAPLAEPVIVIGEPGTGRDAVVRALHELGSTARGSLVRIECAGWEPTRGLPRGAALYLDGVERLGFTAQAFFADLLTGRARAPGARVPRVLASAGPLFGAGEALAEDGRPAPPDARIREGDAHAVRDAGAPQPGAAGSFLAGLRMALTRFPIELPPLRERPEDVGPIAEAIVARLAEAMGRRVSLSPRAVALLAARPWRGNVRQLEQLLERAVAFTRAGTLEPALLGELIEEVENGLGAIRRERAQGERDALLAALRRTGGNVSRTAALLGRSRGAVYRLMAKYGVTGPA